MTLTLLAMGQSQIQGGGVGGVWDIPPSVTIWNNAGNIDTLAGTGNAWVAPVIGSTPLPGVANNEAVQAAKYLSLELGQDVRLILVARGGYAISNWASPGGSMYARMQAVLAAAGVSKVDGFLWHQGEADLANTAAYPASFNALLSRMTTDGYIDADTPIVIGELSAAHAQMNAVLRTISDASPRIGLSDIATFPVLSPSDLHFTGPALVRNGLEMAREMMKLPGPFNHEPADIDYPYVAARGFTEYSTVSGVPTKVPVKAENGKKSLIQGGAFVADRLGVYEFDASGYTLTGRYGVSLLDANGTILQYLTSSDSAGSTTAAQHYDGSAVMALGPGDKVFLGVMQVTGANGPTISPAYSSLINSLTVKYLGRN